MKNLLIAVCGALACFLTTGHVSADIVSTDFNGTTEAGTSLNGITWNSAFLGSGLTLPVNSVTVNNTIQAAGSGDLFTTPDADGALAVANNTSNGGAWETSFMFTTGSTAFTLTSFDFDYRHFNGTGSFQNVVRDATYSVSISDSSGTTIASNSVNTPDVNTFSGAEPETLALTGTLAANTTFTVTFGAADADGPAGNNTGFDSIELVGVEIVPEPCSLAFLSLVGMSALVRRRR